MDSQKVLEFIKGVNKELERLYSNENITIQLIVIFVNGIIKIASDLFGMSQEDIMNALKVGLPEDPEAIAVHQEGESHLDSTTSTPLPK